LILNAFGDAQDKAQGDFVTCFVTPNSRNHFSAFRGGFQDRRQFFKSGYSGERPRIVNCMKQFIAEIWGLIASAKQEGATHREIYQVLAENGFPGTYTTFYTYCLEVSKMTLAQRTRLAKS